MRQASVCQRIRAQVSLELDDALSELERRMLESHLGRCADCRAYSADLRAFTHELRSAPLEPLERPIVVQRRRLGTGRIQIGAAAAVAIAALGIANLLSDSELESPAFSSSVRTMTRYPTQAQLDRELAILARLPERSPIFSASAVVL